MCITPQLSSICRTGQLLQDRVPGSQMLVVMAENFVPAAAREFFLVLRKRLMEFPRSRNYSGQL